MPHRLTPCLDRRAFWLGGRVIDTGRLTLRPPSMADDADVFQYGSQAETVRYLQWNPLANGNEARSFLMRSIAQWRTQERTRVWMIFDKERQGVIGSLRATVADEGLEVGFVVNSLCHRRGYGSEALHAVVSHARLHGIDEISAICDTENRVTHRFLEANGFESVRRLQRHLVHPSLGLEPRDCILYRQRKPSNE